MKEIIPYKYTQFMLIIIVSGDNLDLTKQFNR